MPFMDGFSLSEIVKEEFPKIKIIIISGYDDFEYARQAIKAGVDQYLLKPVTRMTLRNVLLELKEKIEQDMEQKDYQTRYRDEVREFEQFSLRRFFEKLLDGTLSVKEIYEEAAAPLPAAYSPLLQPAAFFHLREGGAAGQRGRGSS